MSSDLSGNLSRYLGAPCKSHLWLTYKAGIALAEVYRSTTHLRLVLRCIDYRNYGDHSPRFTPACNLMNIDIEYPNVIIFETIGNVDSHVPLSIGLPLTEVDGSFRLARLDTCYFGSLLPELLSRKSEDYSLELLQGNIYLMYSGPTAYKRKPTPLLGISKEGVLGITTIDPLIPRMEV